MLDDAHFMQLAITQGKKNASHPFGAVLVHGGLQQVVATGYNRGEENPTWHGEIDAINNYAAADGNDWKALTIYSTAEPCPMCQSAIIWCGIQRVVFGVSIKWLTANDWNQVEISAKEVTTRAAFANCEIVDGVLIDECRLLFDRS